MVLTLLNKSVWDYSPREKDQDALDVPCHGMRVMSNKGGLYPGGDHV